MNIDIENDRIFTRNIKHKEWIQKAANKHERGEFLDQDDLSALALGANLALIEINRREMHRISEEVNLLNFGAQSAGG